MRPIGLLSVTFRKLPVEKIIELTAEADLDGIEWGGDIHVLPGDLKRAAEVGKATADAGLINFSYGSYYRADREPEMIVETAAALGAQWIRIWAGTLASAAYDAEMRRQTVGYLQKLCRRCPAGMQIAAEWHCHTLTDCAASAVKLLDEVGEENFYTCFQRERRADERLDNLNDLLALPPEKIRAIHVQYSRGNERLPLAEGMSEWRELFAHIPENIPALLEFVCNDSVEQFREDAGTLKKLVGKSNN